MSPSPFTFGVELEGAFFYGLRSIDITSIDDGLPLPVDMTMETVYVRNPEFPRNKWMKAEAMRAEMARIVKQSIHDFVVALPLTSRGKAATGTTLDIFQDWVVDFDDSIKLDEMLFQEYDQLWWSGLELQSPAFEATEGAFNEVQAVIDFVRKTFRVAVPPSTGFHVHIGKGPEFYSVHALKRMAAVCWAGDLLFQTMHPINRRFNGYCMGPRSRSQVGRGVKAIEVNPVSDTCDTCDPEKDFPIQGYLNLGRSRRLVEMWKFQRTFPRNSAEIYNVPSEEEKDVCWNFVIGGGFPDGPQEILAGADILQGAKEIMKCRTHDAVSTIMGAESRCAYNFDNYYDVKRRDDKTPKRTVEFRQAAGTMDGHWVTTYAKICLGIAKFAETATDASLWTLIWECHRADKNKIWYDVFDLLLDLGLPEEARVVQNRLETGGHVAEQLRPFSTATLPSRPTLWQATSSASETSSDISDTDKFWLSN